MTEQDKFIFEILFRDAWGAAVSRSKGNTKHKPGINRNNCRQQVRNFCQILVQNSSPITFVQHCNNVSTLESYGLKTWAAQKILSVIMKLYWSIGKMAKPEICPLDRIVLHKGNKINENWTEINDIAKYKDLMSKVLAKHKNIAEWELKFWNDYIITSVFNNQG